MKERYFVKFSPEGTDFQDEAEVTINVTEEDTLETRKEKAIARTLEIHRSDLIDGESENIKVISFVKMD